MRGLVLPVVSGEENKATLLELGAVEPLTKLLTHEDKTVRRNAMMIFGILASNSERTIVQVGCPGMCMNLPSKAGIRHRRKRQKPAPTPIII